MLFCRISFPFDYEYAKEEPLNPAAQTVIFFCIFDKFNSKSII